MHAQSGAKKQVGTALQEVAVLAARMAAFFCAAGSGRFDGRAADHGAPDSVPRGGGSDRLFVAGGTADGAGGETIAAALIAGGVRVFGHHLKDGAPQGLYCANGQCAQWHGVGRRPAVKACMTLVAEGMEVAPLEGLPALQEAQETRFLGKTWFLDAIERVKVPALIIGGGPAGLSAAIELGRMGIETLLIDDKGRLGGKLVLQTHRFFGSTEAVYAGTRGIDIAARLEAESARWRGWQSGWRAPRWRCTLTDRWGSGAGAGRTRWSSRMPCSSPAGRAKRRSPSVAARSPACTGQGRSRRWSTATGSAPRSGC